MKKTGFFKYRADIRPVAMIGLNILMCLLPFVVTMPTWMLIPYFFANLFFVRSYAPYAQHNHGHLPTFNYRTLNWLYDLFLAQSTGYATALWELHHVRGHHRHYLQPEKDVARIVLLPSGNLMPRWRYAFQGNLMILKDSIAIARQEVRDGGKNLLPKLYLEFLCQILITVALWFWNPVLTLALFIIPNLAMAWFIWWESYQHHLDVPLTSAHDGSVTILNSRFNFQTFNIGHHTAHHEKPTLHWSLLPERTRAIMNKISKQCIQQEYRFFAKSRPSVRPERFSEVQVQPQPN